MLSAKFRCNWPSDSGEEDDIVKSLQTYNRMEDEQKAIRKSYLSFQVRWVKKDGKLYQSALFFKQSKLALRRQSDFAHPW